MKTFLFIVLVVAAFAYSVYDDLPPSASEKIKDIQELKTRVLAGETDWIEVNLDSILDDYMSFHEVSEEEFQRIKSETLSEIFLLYTQSSEDSVRSSALYIINKLWQIEEMWSPKTVNTSSALLKRENLSIEDAKKEWKEKYKKNNQKQKF